MAQQTFSGVPGAFAAGAVLTAAEQELIRDFMVALIKEGMTGDTGEILPMIMDLTNNRIVLDSGGLEFSDATTQTTAATAGISWSGSTADGMATYGSASSVVAESAATFASNTLTFSGAGGGVNLDELNSSDANTLDSYEEGIFEVAITAGSGTITVSGTAKYCSYIKVGQIVHIQGAVGVSAISSPSGALNVTGLPFTPHNGLSGDAARSFLAGGITEASAQTLGIFGRIVDGATAINFRAGLGETAEDSSIADVIDTSSQFYISGSYRAAT